MNDFGLRRYSETIIQQVIERHLAGVTGPTGPQGATGPPGDTD